MDWAIPMVALVVLGFAAVSHLLEGTMVTAPMVFVGAGLLLGANALDLVDAAPAGTTVKIGRAHV